MSIFRTTDPLAYDDVDGIVISESAPAPNIQGVAANIVILVGQTQRGPTAMTEVGSITELHEVFGKSNAGVNLALKNKKLGRLKVIRVEAAAAEVAEKEFKTAAVSTIAFAAKQGTGAYGNNIQVKIEAGSVSGKKYTIKDANLGAVMPTEVYDNVQIAQVTADTFAKSNLVYATVMSTAAEPDNTVGFTALAGGADGVVADTDYLAAIEKASVENAGNILMLDSYNTVKNGYLKTHAAETQDKIVILSGPEEQTVAAAISEVANYRDVDGRIIFAYPWVKTVIDGVEQVVNPASFVASVLSQIAPNIDPAYVKNAQFMAGATGLERTLSRAQYIQLKEAGIMALEHDEDVGVKIKLGIVTQILDSSKVTVLRRRMADFLTVSMAKFLKNYQNAPNTKDNRDSIKSGIVSFVDGLERDNILPKDSEVQNGKAKLIDTEVLNTNLSIGLGFMKILYRQRIFGSMRFIVLQAEIGETVVVTEAA